MRLATVESPYDLFAERQGFLGIRGLSHPLGQRGQFVAAELRLRLQAAGKTDHLGLFVQRQGLDFAYDLARSHGKSFNHCLNRVNAAAGQIP